MEFNKILERRNLSVVPLPLWKLKVTDEEYESLKKELRTKYDSYLEFVGLEREAALYYAEWWRREYDSPQKANRKMPFMDLCTKNKSMKGPDQLYETALKVTVATKKTFLKIEIYSGQKNDYFFSLLLQGGLPFHRILSSIENKGSQSVWRRFIRGLVFRNTDFDDLDLGKIASQNNSLQMFCYTMVEAVRENNSELLPFDAEGQGASYYRYLTQEVGEVEKEVKARNPFRIKWSFSFDALAHNLSIDYNIQGPQQLTETFLAQNQLDGKNFFSIKVMVDDKPVFTNDYIQNYSRQAFAYKKPYVLDTTIAIYSSESSEALLTSGFDVEMPHLLYQDDKGEYVLGNKIGHRDSAVLVPESWIIQDEDAYSIQQYTYKGQPMKVIFLPKGEIATIELMDEVGDVITFAENKPLTGTEVVSTRTINANIKETLYDMNEVRFFKRLEDQGRQIVSRSHVSFRDKYAREWRMTPTVGRISARIKNEDGTYTAHTNLINIGRPMHMETISVDEKSCVLRINWPEGNVVTTCGTQLDNGDWHILKENCPDKNYIPFACSPRGSHNSFTISLKLPFKGFVIKDIFGEELQRHDSIPYVELSNYRYHIVNETITLRYDGEDHIIQGYNDYVTIDGQKNRLPANGTLDKLFGGLSMIHQLLDKTAGNLLSEMVEVEVHSSYRPKLSFIIKKYPYKFKVENGLIWVIDNNGKQIDLRCNIQLLSFEKYSEEPLEVVADENGCYAVPVLRTDLGKTLIVSKEPGWVLPQMLDLTAKVEGDEETVRQYVRREDIKAGINAEFVQSTMDSPIWRRCISWFKKCRDLGIPYTSVLEMECVADNPTYLSQMAYMLFLEVMGKRDEEDELISSLLVMQRDLSFHWSWLKYDYWNAGILFGFIGEDVEVAKIMTPMAWWINEKDPSKLIELLTNPQTFLDEFIFDSISKFDVFMKRLATTSVNRELESRNRLKISIEEVEALLFANAKREIVSIYYEFTLGVVASKPVKVDEKMGDGLSAFLPKDGNYSKNEKLFLLCVNLVAAHYSGEINIWECNEKVRRSIQYYFAHFPDIFFHYLNIKMIA